MLVHVVLDYGHGDLAFAEVVQRLQCYLPDAEPVLALVPKFSTRAAGFCVAQPSDLSQGPISASHQGLDDRW